MSTKGLVPINALEIRNPHFLSTTMVGVSIKYFSPASERLAMTEVAFLPGAGIHSPLLGFTFINNDYIQLFKM